MPNPPNRSNRTSPAGLSQDGEDRGGRTPDGSPGTDPGPSGARTIHGPAPGEERLLERFLAAAHAGDKESLLALFAEDAVLIGDGGGKATASPRPIVGAERIAHLMLTVARKAGPRGSERLAELNGEPSVVVEKDGRVVAAMSVESDGERIVACYSVLNSDKLRRV